MIYNNSLQINYPESIGRLRLYRWNLIFPQLVFLFPELNLFENSLQNVGATC